MTQQATIGEAARRLGVSPDTVRRHIRDGKLPASKQPTSRGLVWLVDLPDDILEPGADAAREIERLHEDVGHWREMALSLRQELTARTSEVQQLLALLERAHEQLFPTTEAGPGQTGATNGRRERVALPYRAP
jgi:DNA-binding transcriptional MerR regulator